MEMGWGGDGDGEGKGRGQGIGDFGDACLYVIASAAAAFTRQRGVLEASVAISPSARDQIAVPLRRCRPVCPVGI